MKENPSVWEAASLEQNRRWLLSYIYTMTGRMDLSEDITQEALIVAWKKRDQLKEGTGIGPWLRGIARNLVKQKAAKNSRLRFSNNALKVLEEQSAKLETYHVSGAEEELSNHVLVCLERLKKETRKSILPR